MSKLIAFFILGMLFMGVFGAIMAGGGGPATTRLTDTITATDTTIPVVSTSGFLSVDSIMIGNERILYSSKDATNFYVATNGRGYMSTIADAHTELDNVHSSSAGIMNKMAGYNLGVITEATGAWALVTLPFALLKMMANAIWIDFTFLGTDLAFISYIWIALAIGFVFTVALSMASRGSVF